MRRGVVVAVVHERLDREGGRLEGTEQAVLDVGGVGALLHPYALLEERISARVRPDGRAPLQAEPFDEAMPLRRHRATRPAVDPELPGRAAVRHTLVELGRQQCAPERRGERGDEETVVTARERARDRAGGEAAYPIGAEPLARLGRGDVARDVAPEVEQLSASALLAGAGPGWLSRSREKSR